MSKLVSTQNSNVRLVDPNKENVNNYLPHPLPKYEDMFISVSLTAMSRSRSVLYTQGNILRDVENSGGNVVSFIGMNQRDGDINKNKFTTNYYDGSTGEYVTDESFGIENIKIITDSSYIPRVEIRFVDVRGLSFFSNDKSKYRMLMDFPPPIFNLEVKGYYGSTLKHLLHLTSYETSFEDSNGNHIIDAKFVALTYAPLTDIPFRYIANFGFMKDSDAIYSSDTSEAPKNTYELKLKLKSLYSSINESVKGSEENKNRTTAMDRIEKADNIINYINNIKNRFESDNKTIPHFFKTTADELDEDGGIVVVNSFKNLINSYIPLDSDFRTEKSKIYCGFEHYPENIGNDSSEVSSVVPNYTIDVINKHEKELNEVASQINDYLNEISRGVGIDNASVQINSKYSSIMDTTISSGYVRYVVIDLTSVCDLIIDFKRDNIKLRDDFGLTIANRIKEMVETKLGMEPTIRNIFDILMDDVDLFFNKLKSVSEDAEKGQNRNAIFGNTVKDGHGGKIYPFPLVIKREQSKDNCTTTETRVAPIQQAEGNYIPEMELVLEFIKSFSEQDKMAKLYEIKEAKDENDMNIWIPLSPIDSKYGGLDSGINSPYFYFANSRYRTPGYTNEEQTYKKIVERFIAISQNSHRNRFNLKNDNQRNAFIELFSEGEALNLLYSIVDDSSYNVIDKISKYHNNVNGFINILSKEKHDIHITSTINLNVVGSTPINYSNNRNLVDGEYIGFKIISDNNIYFSRDIETINPDDLFSKFKSETKRKFKDYFSLTYKGDVKFLEFTNDNLAYYKDEPEFGLDMAAITDINTQKPINKVFESYYLVTKFLDGNYKKQFSGFVLDERRIKAPLNTNKDLVYIEPVLYRGSNIVKHWAETLRMGFFREMLTTIEDVDMFMLVVLSNFGSTLSPFNSGSFEESRYRLNTMLSGYNNLNEGLFSNSGVVEIPKFVLCYVGLLSYILDNPELKEKYDNLLEFSVSDKKFRNYAQYISADLGDIKNYMSEYDKNTLIDYYLSFRDIHSEVIMNSVVNLINERKNMTINDVDVNYYDLLNPELNSGIYYFNTIIVPLIERVNLLVYGSKTFSFEPIEDDGVYDKLVDYYDKKENKKNTEVYFKKFLEVINTNKTKKKTQIREEAADLRKITEDNDIINQTYYSFKNINDKWVSGMSANESDYPFISGGKLKDYFAFVDRAMNDIGDTMINGELLVELFDDPNASVFTVISQLLSNNGFEFFPLQNFMSHTNDSWTNSFKISTDVTPKMNSFFVCMYIGGVSSYLNNPDSETPNDGIVDLTTEGLLDFSGCGNNSLLSSSMSSNKFQYSNVFAFIVRYGQQNQSMFKNFKVSSREFPETNESIQILSRLSGDNSDVQPIPKGQNLYSLYENRAYSVTITSLGNMMIQPTQYFQLENVYMYNGVYVILSVEHNITKNHMETTFNGTKILKYPTPRVTSPVAFTEFSDIRFDGSPGELTAVGLDLFEGYLKNIKYESIYTNKINTN